MVSKADNQMQDGLKNHCMDISSDAVVHGFLACRLQVAGWALVAQEAPGQCPGLQFPSGRTRHGAVNLC